MPPTSRGHTPQEPPAQQQHHHHHQKRKRPDDDDDDHDDDDDATARARAAAKRARRTALPDLISPLSDELLVRVLADLPLGDVLRVGRTSRRFHRLAGDSQVWKRLYYARFVLPRALRIPGFRDGGAGGAAARRGQFHYSSRKAIWLDGRRGGWVDLRPGGAAGGAGDVADDALGDPRRDSRHWKRQYKLRHNWSRGKCAVGELEVGPELESGLEGPSDNGGSGSSRDAPPHRTLVKVSEGIAVTADQATGLRAWDLRTKEAVADAPLAAATGGTTPGPSCIAIDDRHLRHSILDVALGFDDGSFGVWRLDVVNHSFTARYRHEKSSNGPLVGIALSHPLLLTATESVLVSLYTFDVPAAEEGVPRKVDKAQTSEKGPVFESAAEQADQSDDEYESPLLQPPGKSGREAASSPKLAAPYLLTSLRSHTSRAPLALSIRKAAGDIVASIAYTFTTVQGWSFGIQELHLKPSASRSKPAVAPKVTQTRLAYALPTEGRFSGHIPSPPASPARSRLRAAVPIGGQHQQSTAVPSGGLAAAAVDGSPTRICYTHPYLLATLPDNTLVLHLCTSSPSSLSISAGIRLWGHTSGISDAEITARGKAVSVSRRGEEIRVWELEGRAKGRSIEVKPTADREAGGGGGGGASASEGRAVARWDDRRDWVGFDDEMVIVLKESSAGQQSLMIYDFT